MYKQDKEIFVEPRRSAPLEVKAEPFSLESLIAWLETKPRDKAYCYTAIGTCLLSQYVEAMGGFRDNSEIEGRYKIGGASRPVAVSLSEYDVLHEVACGNPETFGGALERARNFLQATNGSGS